MNPGNALIKYSSHQTHFSARYPKLPHPWCPHIARNSDIVARNYVISAHRCFGRRDGKSLHHWCSQFYMYYPPSVLNKIVMGFVVFLCPPRVRKSPEPQYLSLRNSEECKQFAIGGKKSWYDWWVCTKVSWQVHWLHINVPQIARLSHRPHQLLETFHPGISMRSDFNILARNFNESSELKRFFVRN